MVDPSGGPYINVGDNLKHFWPRDEYQDLIIESMKFDTKNEDPIVTFKIK